MPSFPDILYDMLYDAASKKFVALQDLHHNPLGVVPLVPIPHASNLHFLQFHNSLPGCQEAISSTPSKPFWIHLLDQNLFDWDRSVAPADMILEKIFVFCFSVANPRQFGSPPYYEGRRIDEVCLYDQVDNLLLNQGLAYIYAVKDSVRDTRNIYNQLCDDANELMQQLDLGFDAWIQKLDEHISIEAEDQD